MILPLILYSVLKSQKINCIQNYFKNSQRNFGCIRDGGGKFLSHLTLQTFLNGTELSEIFWLKKSSGYTQVHRAGDDESLKTLVEEGDLPGYLWKQRLFGGV